MAETPEETIARLEQETLVAGQAEATQAAQAHESPDATLARLQAENAARNAPAGPEYAWWQRNLGQMNTSLANIIGFAGTPVIGPITRPEPGSPEAVARESLPASERIAEEISRSQGATQSLFERLGFIPPQLGPPQGVLEHASAELPGAILTTAATLGAAPLAEAATAGSTGAIGQTINRFAGEMAARPATFARSMIGSEPGMVIGREAARPYIEGVTPNADTSAPQAAVRSALMFGAEMLGSVPTDFMARKIIPVPRLEQVSAVKPRPQPVLSDVPNPEVAGRIVRARQVSLLDTIDRAFAITIERAGVPGLNEATASRRLRGGLLAARDFMSDEVTRAYNEIPNYITGNPSGFRDSVLDQLNDARRFPAVADTYPVERLQGIQQQLMAGRDAQGRPIWRQDIPISELNDIRSRLIQQGRDASEVSVLGSQASRELQRNINHLTDELTHSIEAIGTVEPRFQPAYDYANSTYRMYNDRFRRGPIGDLLMTTRHTPLAREGTPELPGSGRFSPTEFAQQLLNGNETADAIAQAVERMGDTRGATILRSLIQQRVVNNVEDAVRTVFTDQIRSAFEQGQASAIKPANVQDIQTAYQMQPGPLRSADLAARKWMDKYAPVLERFTNVTSQLYRVSDRLNRLVQARNDYTTNIASQFIGRPAAEVISQTLRAPNSHELFQSLFRQFNRSPEILEGLQRGLIDNVFEGYGADPNQALARLREAPYRDAFEALFRNDPSKVDRLYQLTKDAADITSPAISSTASGRARLLPNEVYKQQPFLQRVKQTILENVFRIGGLATGHVLLGAIPLMGSAAALSVPMRMGRAGRELVASAWLKGRLTALSVVKDAVFDPGLEAWLRNNAPNNYTDMQSSLDQISRYLRRFEAATNDDINKYIASNGDKLYWEERRKIRAEMVRRNASPFRGQ